MTTKFKGIPITLGDQRLVVPPLNFRSLQQLQARLSEFKGGVDAESIDIIVDAAHAALQRNYPQMTKDEVIDGLDLDNMMEVFEAVMDVSGLKRKALEAAADPEGTAANPSTGPNSTPA